MTPVLCNATLESGIEKFSALCMLPWMKDEAYKSTGKLEILGFYVALGNQGLESFWYLLRATSDMTHGNMNRLHSWFLHRSDVQSIWIHLRNMIRALG